ncbi:phage holin family protein [Dongia deserti]|uniref:phage holin family protein n=1 Tax=Dongia deserti TaxID=2268030 RepID=UPI000E649EB3|nr:phage holin family protein [Dongia deserti]
MAKYNVRPIPEIFTDLVAQVTTLVRKESRLARAEVSEKAGRAISGIAMILLGSVLLIPALVILLQAAIAGLVENGMERAVASLIVGGGAFIIGMVIGLTGWSWVKPASLVPDKTIDQLKRDAEVPRHSSVTAHYGETGGSTSERMAGQETAHGERRDRAA